MSSHEKAMGIPPEVLAQMKNVQAQDPEVFVQSLPADVKARVEHLKGLHEQYAELHKAYVQERRALELKYRVQYEPLFESRAKVVTGEAAVDGAEEGSTKGIPGFWLRCLNNHPLIQEMISEKDEQVLQHLQDITIAFTEPGPPAALAEGDEEREAGEENSFTLTFHFSENAFFDNSQLTKVYSFADAEGTVLQRAVGTEINWKPGKDVTVKVLRKKPKKGAKPGPPVTKTEKVPSFFDFFSPVAIPEEGEDIEEDDMDELHESIEQDYEVGATIRDKLIPQALRWFTGEAARDEGMLVEFEEEDDEDDDDVDSDEEDDDDDDDDEDAPNLVPLPNSKKGAKKGGKSSGTGAAAGGDSGATPECKQQ